MGGAVACSVTGVRGDKPTNHSKHDKQTNPTNHQPVKAGEKQERRKGGRGEEEKRRRRRRRKQEGEAEDEDFYAKAMTSEGFGGPGVTTRPCGRFSRKSDDQGADPSQKR